MGQNQNLETLDINLAAYCALRGLPPELVLVNGRILFRFPAGQMFYQLSSEFNSNDLVPILEFVTSLKTLRGKMISAKEREKGKGGYYGNQFNK